MEVLNQSNIPFGAGVRNILESEISQYLSKRLTLRSTVDFKDQYTFETDAVPTKNLKSLSSSAGLEVSAREPIKMLEVKKAFTVPAKVIEDIKRGKEDFDNSVLTEAVNSFAAVENDTILNGNKKANIDGILSKIENKLTANDTKEILSCTAKSLGVFNTNFVDGPFKLIASSNTLAKLYTESFDGMSLKAKIEEILGSGAIIINQDIGDDKALIISQRGGDFEFYSGLDVSLGFEKESAKGVELFLLQTFAFRNISPEAAVLIEIK